jgi:hypothetical protein
VTENEHIEERLRRSLRAVAGLPTPDGASPEPTTPGWRSPTRLRSFRLLATVASVLVLGAAVGLALAYGPGGGRGGHGRAPSTPAGGGTTTVPMTRPPDTTIGTGATTSTTTSPPVPTTTIPPPTTTVAGGTQTVTYEPFVGGQVDPSLHVTGHSSGPCFEYGGGAQGRDYYRCGTTQPCFAGPQGTSAPLLCPAQQDPATGDVVEWTPTTVDSSFTPTSSRAPWAMQLSSGAICWLVNAAWSGLGPFGCTGGGQTPADCRTPVSAQPYWSAACQDQLTQTSPFVRYTVVTVWF